MADVPNPCPRCGAPLALGERCGRCQGADPEALPELPPVRVGDLFEGKWRIESKLGAGGMGSVFLAHDLALDRKVAIKVLARELCRDASFVTRFEREARLTARLEHPNVVPVYAVGRHQGRPFMVMKRLDGETLGFHLQAEGKLAPARVLDVMRQVCSGLSHIHAHGCVHRDIKAGNIFISPTGHATILDFGVLRDPNSGGTTQAGMLLGTPRYMSPEQARGATDVDLRADLYALGVLLFECLTGRAPFEAATDLAVIHMHARDEPPDVVQLEPSLPPAVGPMIRRALAKDPADRYPSADEFFSAFDVALTGTGLAAVPQFAEPSSSPPLAPGSVPADPTFFDPDSFPQAAPDPTPLPTPAAAPVPAPLPAEEPRPRRRLFWPVVATLAILLAAGELAFLHFGTDREGPPEAPPPAKSPESDRPERPNEPRRPVKQFGTLKVVSVLSGKPYPAAVVVDGQARGETPVTLELQTGKHTVRVHREGFQTFEREAAINARQTTTVKVDLLP